MVAGRRKASGVPDLISPESCRRTACCEADQTPEPRDRRHNRLAFHGLVLGTSHFPKARRNLPVENRGFVDTIPSKSETRSTIQKSEIRSTKSETNPKLEARMFKTRRDAHANGAAAREELRTERCTTERCDRQIFLPHMFLFGSARPEEDGSHRRKQR